jgi:hypothetical protein
MQVMKSFKSISKLWWVQGQQPSACFTIEIDLRVSTLSEGRVKTIPWFDCFLEHCHF